MGKLLVRPEYAVVAGEFPLDEQTVAVAGASLARIIGRNLAKTKVFERTRYAGIWAVDRTALHSGFAAGGAESTSAGVMTTPGVAYLADAQHLTQALLSALRTPLSRQRNKNIRKRGQKGRCLHRGSIERDIAFSEHFGLVALSLMNLVPIC